MGGSAFTTPPYSLSTPRMPPEVYHQVMDSCRAILDELYVITASPIEAPGKKDFGDIDFLVTQERSSAEPESDEPVSSTPGPGQRPTRDQLVLIGEKLQARHSIIHSPPVSANFAIPWPVDPGQRDQQPVPTEAFIQVDVRICEDEQQVRWALFKHAHGDLWNIIGSMIRPYGLTVDEQALWIRIPEIEKFDKKKAKVKLTEDPREVIEFLGMEYDGFWATPFESVDALYQYATTCRLFLVREAVTDQGSPRDSSDAPGAAGGAEGKKSLKSNDRRRMNQRPLYRNWISEVIPKLSSEGRFVCKDPDATIPKMRSDLQEEALRRFSAEKEFEDRLRAWRVVKQTEAVKAAIKELVPENADAHYRGTLLSAMKKSILENDQTFGVFPQSPFRKDDGLWDMEVVRSFIVEKAWELGEVAWARQCKRAEAAMNEKRAREEAMEEANKKIKERARREFGDKVREEAGANSDEIAEDEAREQELARVAGDNYPDTKLAER